MEHTTVGSVSVCVYIAQHRQTLALEHTHTHTHQLKLPTGIEISAVLKWVMLMLMWMMHSLYTSENKLQIG